jgi:hypothetical protein
MSQYQIDNLIATATTLVVLVLGAAIVLVVMKRRMTERQETRRAILEKISGEEMVRLLETESGRLWLREVLSGANDVRARVERAMTVLFAGIGCGIAAAFLHERTVGVFAAILTAASIGHLVTLAIYAKRRDGQ